MIEQQLICRKSRNQFSQLIALMNFTPAFAAKTAAALLYFPGNLLTWSNHS
jgi:hypothetical protein